MLALNAPRWSSLTHAYGRAGDIPELIRALAKETGPKSSYDSEPWFSIWSSLCHQDDVFDASYAAVPHIVEIGCNASGPIDFSFFQFPTAVEVARNNGRGPSVPPDLADAYHEAIKNLEDSISRHRDDEWDEETLLSALAAQAVAKGNHRIAEAVLNLDETLIQRLIDLDFD